MEIRDIFELTSDLPERGLHAGDQLLRDKVLAKDLNGREMPGGFPWWAGLRTGRVRLPQVAARRSGCRATWGGAG
jgi:hypothetical protein